MFSESSGDFIWRTPSVPTLGRFPKVSLDILDLLPSIVSGTQPGFSERSGSRGKTYLTTFSTIIIEV